jgi:hypothetical protein
VPWVKGKGAKMVRRVLGGKRGGVEMWVGLADCSCKVVWWGFISLFG